MDTPKAAAPLKEFPSGLDESTEQEYARQSKVLLEFISISSIDTAWLLKSHPSSGNPLSLSLSLTVALN